MTLAQDLAEAFTSGVPIRVPADADRDIEDAAGQQGAVIRLIDLPPAGVRLARGPDGAGHAGPVFASRVHATGAVLPVDMFHRPAATAALLITLSRDTASGADPRRLVGTLRPALDIAASRLLAPPSVPQFVADLAGLGAIVAGPARRLSRAALVRAAGTPPSLDAWLVKALDAFGDLPAGAMLVLADLSDAMQPEAGDTLTASLPGLPEVSADFV